MEEDQQSNFENRVNSDAP